MLNTMGDDTLQPQPPSHQQRRTSIATIFNPRKQKGGPSGGSSSQGPYLGPRPSVVVTDEDTPYPIQLTNGGESLRGYASPRGSFGRMGRSGSFNLVSFSHHNEGDTGMCKFILFLIFLSVSFSSHIFTIYFLAHVYKYFCILYEPNVNLSFQVE